MPSERTSRSFYHPELDILRFVAFALVFLWHLYLYTGLREWSAVPHLLRTLQRAVLKGGVFGVDLFFALSAYLITELLLRERRSSGEIRVGSFYLRRILRIWPLYFAVLLVVRPLFEMAVPLDHFRYRYLAAFLLLSGNWSIVWWGWPDSFVNVLWSVSIEEQFYLGWPFVLKRAHGNLPWICVGIFLFSSLAQLLHIWSGSSNEAIYADTLTRMQPIAAGALLACLLNGKVKPLSPFWRSTGVICATAIFLLVGWRGGPNGPLALFSYPAIALASMLLIYALLRPLGSWTPGLVGRKFIYLGKISYGLYVFHLGAIFLMNHWNLHPPQSAILSLALTVLVAALSYQFLEKPFLQLRERFAVVVTRPV